MLAVTNPPLSSSASRISLAPDRTAAGSAVPCAMYLDRVPRGSGHCRRFLALAADVADGHAPACWGAVDVVEVGADLDALRGRDVGRRELDAGDLRQAARQQAGLERIGYLSPAAEHVVDPDGEGKLLAEFGDEAEIGDVEVTLSAALRQRQNAVAFLAVGDRDGQHGRRAEQHQQRDVPRPGTEQAGVLGMGDQHGLSRFVDLLRQGAWRGVQGRGGIADPGQSRALRPDHELAAQPPSAIEVNDHPGSQLAGQQAGAALQGHGLAEVLVLQQEPGHGGHQVHPLSDGLDRPGWMTIRCPGGHGIPARPAAGAAAGRYRGCPGLVVGTVSVDRVADSVGDGHDEPVGITADADQSDGQHPGRGPGRTEQAASDPGDVAAPGHRAELRLHRGPALAERRRP